MDSYTRNQMYFLAAICALAGALVVGLQWFVQGVTSSDTPGTTSEIAATSPPVIAGIERPASTCRSHTDDFGPGWTVMGYYGEELRTWPWSDALIDMKEGINAEPLLADKHISFIWYCPPA